MIELLIVGAGLTGATVAALANDHAFQTLILEKRDYIGGNCWTTRNQECGDIDIHMHGPHIFHTDNKTIWDFAQTYATFIPFSPQVKAQRDSKLYSLPFSMSTFYEIWGITNPAKAKEQIEKERYTGPVRHLEDQARSLVGDTIYELLIRDYTEKQWGKPCHELPAFIIKRLPLRYTFNSLYFNDRYIGVPKQGYTTMIQEMIGITPVLTAMDYLENKEYWNKQAKVVLYTGCIDEYYDYDLGMLEYRTLDFQHSTMNVENAQGNAIINDTSTNPWTRTIEHKHFKPVEFDSAWTVVTKETPRAWKPGDIPYYPVPTQVNQDLYRQYRERANNESNVVFGGRLGKYKYMDMHVAIENAMNLYNKEILPRL